MVRIITDSAADMEPWEYEKLNISCVPLGVTFGDRDYRENENLSKDEFYALLQSSPDFPKTSQGSPALVEQLLTQAREAGDEVVFICLSSGFSGFYQSVCAMAQGLDMENCHIVDSLTGTGGQRMLVEYAARLRDEGKCAADIAAAIESIKGRVIIYACMDTLEYLYRGGRISHASYKLGSMANIKPILFISHEGLCEIPAKAIGMRKGMDYMCRRLDFHLYDESFPLYVMFTGRRGNGEKLAQRLRGLGYDIPDSRIINVGAAIGSHVGPNACGLVYIEK